MTHATDPDRALMETVWEHTADESGIADVARVVCLATAKNSRFCLWLCGPVGAGKTTIASAVLHEMGLPAKIPVLSPTYTYIQEYQLIDGRRVAHMDLYRGTAIDALEESGIFSNLAEFAGLLIEWPPVEEARHHAKEHGYDPTHMLAITPVEQGARRRYQLSVAR